MSQLYEVLPRDTPAKVRYRNEMENRLKVIAGHYKEMGFAHADAWKIAEYDDKLLRWYTEAIGRAIKEQQKKNKKKNRITETVVKDEDKPHVKLANEIAQKYNISFEGAMKLAKLHSSLDSDLKQYMQVITETAEKTSRKAAEKTSRKAAEKAAQTNYKETTETVPKGTDQNKYKEAAEKANRKAAKEAAEKAAKWAARKTGDTPKKIRK